MGVRGIQYRNQTQLHEWLTKQTLNFLADKVTQRGVIWRQEHTIHNGMRPDAIAFCSLQQSHYCDLFGIKPLLSQEYRKLIAEKGFNYDDPNRSNEEWLKLKAEVLQEHYNVPNEFMIVFETKISYSDYKSSFNGTGEWKEQPYANLHFLVCPKDFTLTYDLSGLPEYWGILEPDPRSLKVKRMPKFMNIDRLFFLEAAYTILFKWGCTLNLLKLEHENADQF